MQDEINFFGCITLGKEGIKPVDFTRLKQRNDSPDEVLVLAVEEMDLLGDVLLS